MTNEEAKSVLRSKGLCGDVANGKACILPIDHGDPHWHGGDRKPWEETWRAVGNCLEDSERSVFNEMDSFEQAAFIAEAPAMWRWIAKREFGDTSPNGWATCFDCGEVPLLDGAAEHHPACEWLRIAKAIGYRS